MFKYIQIRSLFTFLYFLFSWIYCVAQDFNTPINDVNEEISYLIDDSNSLSLDEVKKVSFTSTLANNLNFGITTSSVWIRIRFPDRHTKSHYFLSIHRPVWDSLTFYYSDATNTEEQVSYGYLTDNLTTNGVIVLKVPINNKEIYIKGNSRYPLIFPLKIESEHSLEQTKFMTSLFRGILIGGLFIMFIYNFFLAISLKSRTYGNYCIIVMVTLVIQLGLWGYSGSTLCLSPEADFYTIRWFIIINLIVSIVFAIDFLNLRQVKPNFNKGFIFLLATTFIPLILDVLGFNHLSIRLLMLISLIITLSLASVVYYVWLKLKIQGARYYALAWTIYFIGLIIYILKSNGDISHNWFTDNFVHLAKLLEITLLSFALGYKYRELQKEKNRLQDQLTKGLEEQVASRTSELSIAVKEKDILLHEVHHRVKNNLQIINSMLSIQRRRYPQEIKPLITSVQNRIESIALVHKSLYNSDQVSQINFSTYLVELIDHLKISLLDEQDNENKTHVSFHIDIQTGILCNLNIAIPLGIAINEIITNSLKHAFQYNIKGDIYVSLHKDDYQIKLELSDNGQVKPLGKEKENSIGSRLITDMIHQAKAKVKLNNTYSYQYIINFMTE